MEIFPVYYFPPVSWFAAAAQAGEIVLDQHQFYKKQQYFNRMNVLGANGVLKLSVPIQKAAEYTPLMQRTVSEDGKWRKDHWRSLESAYRSSPFFEFYEGRIAPIFEEAAGSLLELNLRTIRTAIGLLDLEIDWKLSESYIGNDQDDAADHRQEFQARSPVGLDWFRAAPYQQVFGEEFVPDLSILDLLFNCGPESVRILRESYRPS